MTTFLESVRNDFFNNFNITLNETKNRSTLLSNYTVTCDGNRTLISYKVSEEILKVELSVYEKDDTCVFFIDALLDNGNWCEGNFTAENTVDIPFYPSNVDSFLGSTYFGRWWQAPVFAKEFGSMNVPLKNLLFKKGDEYYELLPLIGDNFRSEVFGNRITLTTNMSGVYHLTGPVFAISRSKSPYDALHNAFLYSREVNAIKVAIKEQRKYPERLEGFGFCTWDAFYHEVTSEKIYRKLDEFKEKNIPVKWLLIDDGWMSTDGGRIFSFEENREKFPEGFKATISHIKEHYGIERVGVWHTINGYWDGVKEGSPLFESQKKNLIKTVRDIWVPSLDPEKAFAFWDTWHTYLSDCGVDFVKVDNQAAVPMNFEGTMETAKASYIVHSALDRSVFKNFDGAIINCMGMDIENIFNRPQSALNRNSDDFSPRNPGDFIKHINQNCYNSLWHDELHFCDFDMWWSDHDSAVRSGVLRAISGSPVYVSDELGRSRRETIIPIVENDGYVPRCDHACKPTEDCLFVNCSKEKKLLKVFNTSGENTVVAAFNISDEEIEDEVSLKYVPVISGDKSYAGYEYFSKEWKKMGKDTVISIKLQPGEVRVWSVYPVKEDGSVLAGDLTKYVSAASTKKTIVFPKYN